MQVLPTNNEAWGMWHTAESNGLDQQATWERTSHWLQSDFGLDPVDARNFLDSRHGRHLADALTYMTLDQIGAKWKRWLVRSIAEVKANRERF